MNILLKALILSGTLAIAMTANADPEAVFARKLAQAESGNIEAQYDVGYRYEKGRGVEEDDELAFKWYLKAAEQGLDTAQYKVGMCLLEGAGVDVDKEQGRLWLEKAATQGYPPAQYHLGKFYANDRHDYALALTWLEKAQENGYMPATREIFRVKKALN